MRGESMKGKSKKSTYSTTFGVDPCIKEGFLKKSLFNFFNINRLKIFEENLEFLKIIKVLLLTLKKYYSSIFSIRFVI